MTSATQSAKSEKPEWRCFHCDEIFTDRRCAADHFGASEDCEPACQIKMGAERSMLTALRRAENDANEMMQRLQTETTDSAKAYYAQTARHQEQLRIAEELGFERGLIAERESPAPSYWIVTWPGKDQGVHAAYKDLKEAEHAAKNIANYSTKKTETTVVPLYAALSKAVRS